MHAFSDKITRFEWVDLDSMHGILRVWEQDGARLVVGEAQRIDRETHQVTLADGTSYQYDDLVIATGAHLAPEAIPGYAEAAHHFCSPEAAVRLRDALEAFQGGKVLIGVADISYKCPPAPLEFTFLLDEYLRKSGPRERTEITYLSPINRVFTIESVSNFVTPLLEERGIQHEESSSTPSRLPRPLVGLSDGRNHL